MTASATVRLEESGRPSRAAYDLEFEHVSKAFLVGGRRIEALKQVSLRVRRGLITGLIGSDGAGKTTLLRLATGLLTPDTGSIRVLGLNAATESLAVQAAIGYMPQRFGLYDDLTVQENLNLYADLQGVPAAARSSRYQELMQMTGLAPFTSRLAGRLSGGMKQKLGLACTLVQPPRLLLLDEPTVGVDPVSRRELWAIVDRLVRDEGMSVCVSTAYLDEAERCHEIFLFHEGHILGQGPPATFSVRVQDRTFLVSVPGPNKRAVQTQLAREPEVLDAVIQGDGVRVVTKRAGQPSLSTLLSQAPGIVLQPVLPRFEDSFVALLRGRMTPTAPGSAHTPEPSEAEGGISPQARSQHLTQEDVIQVQGVERWFGTFGAVRDLSFTVRRGEIFGLLGANGAGKTTTFRMLCGLLPPSGGTLRVADVDLRRAPATARARIGYMSQKFSLYGDLSVLENLHFFARAYGLSGTRRAARVTWALEQFGLAALADSTSATLSLGYRQRLALACALMHEPEILFLDEPTSGVDPLERREFWRRITSLADRGVTVMITTHFMDEAEYCDRLLLMAAGRMLTLGTPADIKAKARSGAPAQPTMEEAFIRLIEANQQPR